MCIIRIKNDNLIPGCFRYGLVRSAQWGLRAGPHSAVARWGPVRPARFVLVRFCAAPPCRHLARTRAWPGCPPPRSRSARARTRHGCLLPLCARPRPARPGPRASGALLLSHAALPLAFLRPPPDRASCLALGSGPASPPPPSRPPLASCPRPRLSGPARPAARPRPPPPPLPSGLARSAR